MAGRHGSAPEGLAVRGPSLLGLRKIEILKDLDLRVLRQVANRCRWTRYKRNEYVIRRKTSNREVHFVVSGLLRVLAQAETGKRIVFHDVPAGDLFGESAAIDGQSHFADVLCTRESLIASISAEAFRALLANQATVRERVLRRLTSSVRALAERILDLRTLPVASRVCGELLRLAENARTGDSSVILDPFPTHEELAHRVGTSREQVTRELSRLQREGIVLRKGRSLRVHDLNTLARLVKDLPENGAAYAPPEQEFDRASLQSQRQRRALLVAEAQTDGRIMEVDERRAIEQWNIYLTHVISEAVPRYEGRSFSDAVKQRFVADFPDCRRALDCAFDLHQAFAKFSDRGRPPGSGLRIGLHTADIMMEPFQIAGEGVQIAAGLAKLANPRETVISVQVRDRLTSGLNVSIEDLGEQRLRNRERPVRVFRTWPPSHSISPRAHDVIRAHGRPSVAVVPFQLFSNDTSLQFAGVGLADETIASLSRVADFFVVSRLSSMAFRHSSLTARSIGEILGVQYVLSGTLHSTAGRVRLLAELSETRDGRVLWSEQFECAISDVLAMQEGLARSVVRSVAPFIRTLELRRARLMNDEQRESYALTMLGIDLMHRMSKEDFLSARSVLERALARDPVSAGPHAWLAKWHILRVATGNSENPAGDHHAAIHSAERALACDSKDALALAVDGLVCGWSRSDLDRAQRRLAEALASNPNESLAWLWNGIVYAWRGCGIDAVYSTDQALSLSPLDPMSYYFYSLASTANMVAGRYDRAIDFAQRSVRENCLHTPSWRTLAVSQVLAGQLAEARVAVHRLRALEPDLTVTSFKARYPGRDSPQIDLFTKALRTAGLPR